MRNELAEKLELIGSIFEIDGMDKLVNKFEKGISIIKYNAITIQIESLLLKKNPEVAEQLVAAHLDKTVDEIKELSDAEYAVSLRDAITTDVIGFFASSPHTDGQK